MRPATVRSHGFQVARHNGRGRRTPCDLTAFHRNHPAENSMIRRLLLLLVLCGFAGLAGAAEQTRAWFDRDSVQLGETVTLNVETTESASEPDFSVLEADFELLGRSSSSSVSIVNGSASSTMLWAVGLKPRREGKLTVPALPVGKSATAPVVLTVGAAPDIAAANPGDDFFIEVTADPLTAYVQQQIRVTVKFFYAVNLTDGAVEELSAPNAVVQKLGQDRSYDVERSNRRYRVLERRYAVTAQKSGPLDLPALNFRGRALSGDDANAMFLGRGRAVTTRSEALSVAINPRPAGSGGGAWLPAQSLQLQAEGADGATQGRVGEPLTITLTVVAQGLGFEQLPELELPPIDGADIYPDKSVTRSRENSGWIVGERSRKFAIVPKRAGTLRIPPASLDWWDTAADSAAKAQTREITIEVAEAAPGATPAATAPAASGTSGTAALPGEAELLIAFWRFVALVALGLWLLTLAIWFVSRRRGRASPAAPAAVVFSPTRRSFEQAVEAGDVAAAAQRLLAWARSEGLRAQHLGELAAQLDSAAQRDAVAHLQAVLYGGNAGAAMPRDFATPFAAGFARAPRIAANEDGSVLPPLWNRS